MPIIESVAASAPLGQGDLLDGIPLFVSSGWWAAGAKGDASRVHRALCLVLSRPCVCAHKSRILVCPVEVAAAGTLSTSEAETAEDVVDYLKMIRDGQSSPDRIYLGEVPGRKGRFFAKIDSIHTIDFPESADRQVFLAAARVGRLTGDFSRDLHSRLFRSFASLGFDDVGWLCNADLDLIVLRCEHELATAKAAMAAQRRAAGDKEIAGKSAKPEDVQQAEKRVKECEEFGAPYFAEQKRRQTLAASSAHPRTGANDILKLETGIG